MSSESEMSSILSRFAVTLSLTMVISGCGGGYYTVDPLFSRDPQAGDESYYSSEREQGELWSEKVINFESKNFTRQLKAARSSRSDRNDLLLKLLIFSDRICVGHLGSIKGTATQLNVSLGVATSWLSALATLTTGTAAKTYAATSTLTNASRSIINEEVYRQHFADAIIDKINENRKAKRNLIVSGFDKGVDSYSIDRGIADLIDFHGECSFYRGASTLLEAAKQRPVIGGYSEISGTAGNSETENSKPTTVNPIVGDGAVDATVALMSDGYASAELRLVAESEPTKVIRDIERSTKVVTGAAMRFTLPESSRQTFESGALVRLAAIVAKTPKSTFVVGSSDPVVYYRSTNDSKVKAEQKGLDLTTKKLRILLTFPKNARLAWPALSQELAVTASYAGKTKSGLTGGSCRLGNESTCDIEFDATDELVELHAKGPVTVTLGKR